VGWPFSRSPTATIEGSSSNSARDAVLACPHVSHRRRLPTKCTGLALRLWVKVAAARNVFSGSREAGKVVAFLTLRRHLENSARLGSSPPLARPALGHRAEHTLELLCHSRPASCANLRECVSDRWPGAARQSCPWTPSRGSAPLVEPIQDARVRGLLTQLLFAPDGHLLVEGLVRYLGSVGLKRHDEGQAPLNSHVARIVRRLWDFPEAVTPAPFRSPSRLESKA